MKALTILLMLSSLLGCTATEHESRLVRRMDRVYGPVNEEAPKGRLMVRTDPLEFEDDMFVYYRHRPYEILDGSGRLVRRIRNNIGVYDETPTEVLLEPGRYVVRVPTKHWELVEFAVEIRPDSLTLVEAGSGPRRDQS